jgi:hypothetical protein
MHSLTFAHFRAAAYLFSALFALTISSCGGKSPFADQPRSELKRVDMSRAELVQAIAELELKGVEAQVAAELRTELTRLVANSDQARWVSTPPRGNANNVTDLALVQDGDSRQLRWTYRNSGDYDLNGEANISDISVLGVHLGKESADADWDAASRADGDGNGAVTIADLTPLGANLFGQVSAYRILGAANAEDELTEIGTLVVTKELLGQALELTFEVPAGPWIMFAVEPLDAADAAGARSNLCGAGITLDEFPGSPGNAVNASLPQIEFPLGDKAAIINTPDGLPLVGNRIGILFEAAATVGEANSLLALLGAEVIGSDPFTNVVLLRIPQVADTDALRDVLSTARSAGGVQVACCDMAGIGIPDPSEDYPQVGEHASSSSRELPPARLLTGEKEFGFTFPDTSRPGARYRWGIENVRAPQGWNLRTYGQRQGTPPEAIVVDIFAPFAEDWYGDIELRKGLVFKPIDPNAPPRPYETHGSQAAETLGANWWNQEGFESINPLQPEIIAKDRDLETETYETMFLNGFALTFAEGLCVNPEAVIVNHSWGLGKGLASVSNAEWMDPLGDVFYEGAAWFAADYRSNFLICSAAGYEGDETGALLPYDSAMNNAAVRYPDSHYLSIEAIDTADAFTGIMQINLGGTVSAPGYLMPLSGTSFATPMVSSLISYIWALDPTLTWQQVKTLVKGVDFAVQTTGGTRARIDAYNAVMGIDKLKGTKTIQQAMVDVDDGTPDGQARFNPFDGTAVTTIDTPDGQRGDGLTTMRDFRAWRDAFLDVETTLSDKLLDGPALHFKRDLNMNGLIGQAVADPPHAYPWNLANVPANPGESIYSRYDFNGDGVVDMQSAPVNGEQLTDLDMLTDIDLWQSNELDGYVEGIYVDPAKEGIVIAGDTWQPARYLLANRDAESDAPQELQDLPDYLHSFDLHLLVDFSEVPVEIESLEVTVATELWPDGVDNNGEDGIDEPFEQVLERTAQIPRDAQLPYIVTLPLWTGKARVQWDSATVSGTLDLTGIKFGEDRPATIPAEEWYFEHIPSNYLGHPAVAVINDLPGRVYGNYGSEQVFYEQATDSRATDWNSPTVVRSTSNAGPQVLLEAGGVPCLGFVEDDKVKFMRALNAAGTSWDVPLELAAKGVDDASINVFAAFGTVDNRPAVAYVRRKSSGEFRETIEYVIASDPAGDSWGPAEIALGPVASASVKGLIDVAGKPTIMTSMIPTSEDESAIYLLRGADAEGGFGAPLSLGVKTAWTLSNINGTPAVLLGLNGGKTIAYQKALDSEGAAWGPIIPIHTIDTASYPRGAFLVEVADHPAVGLTGEGAFFYVRAEDADGLEWPPITKPLQQTPPQNMQSLSAAVIEERPMFMGWSQTAGYGFGILR